MTRLGLLLIAVLATAGAAQPRVIRAPGRGWFLLPSPSDFPWQGKLKFTDVYGADLRWPCKGAN